MSKARSIAPNSIWASACSRAIRLRSEPAFPRLGMRLGGSNSGASGPGRPIGHRHVERVREFAPAPGARDRPRGLHLGARRGGQQDAAAGLGDACGHRVGAIPRWPARQCRRRPQRLGPGARRAGACAARSRRRRFGCGAFGLLAVDRIGHVAFERPVGWDSRRASTDGAPWPASRPANRAAPGRGPADSSSANCIASRHRHACRNRRPQSTSARRRQGPDDRAGHRDRRAPARAAA